MCADGRLRTAICVHIAPVQHQIELAVVRRRLGYVRLSSNNWKRPFVPRDTV